MATLFGSRVRAGILAHLGLCPGWIFGIRDLARRIGASAPAVLRELKHLEGEGLVRWKRAGAARGYTIRWKAPGYAALAKYILARQILPRLIRRMKPQVVYLFGSFARGTPGPWSDVDLLIVADTDKPDRERTAEARRCLDSPVFAQDVFVLTPREFALEKKHAWTVVAEVLRSGEVLYERAA